MEKKAFGGVSATRERRMLDMEGLLLSAQGDEAEPDV